MITMSEFAEMLRLIFSAAERTCNAEDVAAFKDGVLRMVAREFSIEIEDLRAMYEA